MAAAAGAAAARAGAELGSEPPEKRQRVESGTEPEGGGGIDLGQPSWPDSSVHVAAEGGEGGEGAKGGGGGGAGGPAGEEGAGAGKGPSVSEGAALVKEGVSEIAAAAAGAVVGAGKEAVGAAGKKLVVGHVTVLLSRASRWAAQFASTC